MGAEMKISAPFIFTHVIGTHDFRNQPRSVALSPRTYPFHIIFWRATKLP